MAENISLILGYYGRRPDLCDLFQNNDERQACHPLGTLDNPRGSTVIDVTLSDGTRVWLNAGSSIRCPAVFPSDDRTVEIRGEAYFEVAGDADRPFRVKKGNVTVNVLGTSFNVRAYSDEPLLRVTLVGGKVRVTADNSLILEPGEQAVVEV